MDVFEFAHPICPNYDIIPPILASLISHRSKETFLREFFLHMHNYQGSIGSI